MRISPFKIIAAIAMIGSVAAGSFAAYFYYEGHEDISYDESLSSAYTTSSDQLLAQEIDFAALKARNPDTIGWIYLPDTIINYPVVQTTDNSTYLTKRFDGTATPYGTIFADHRIDPHTDRNLILYGHNQGQFNPVKFTLLYNYLTDPNFIKEHSYFEYYDADTGKGTVYDVFAVLRADITTQINIDNYYQDVSQDKYEWYLNWLQSQTLVASDVKVDPSKRSLILSTCTDDAHWQRVLVCCLER